jgi:undecaprenyl diphosphate synthase
VSAPKYVAIVTDGPDAGDGPIRARLRDAAELGIEELAVCAPFGAEIAARAAELGGDGVRVRFVGRRDCLDPGVAEQVERAEAETAGNAGIALFVAVGYDGRAEIVDAARSFQGSSEEEFRNHLYAPEMHDPDLLIRTNGEQRISSYLLWQSAYSELVFSERSWPDFDRAALEAALAEYETRQRRFGARA